MMRLQSVLVPRVFQNYKSPDTPAQLGRVFGYFLAFAGALLIAMSLYVPTSVESSDVAIYLPRQVEVVGSGPGAGGSDVRDPPTPMGPAAPDAAPAGKELDSMPQSLKQRLTDPSASTTSR